MSIGFPEGTPLRRALTFTYNHVESVQFLRTTYKAGPLVALAVACLAGAAAQAVWPRLRARPARAAARTGRGCGAGGGGGVAARDGPRARREVHLGRDPRRVARTRPRTWTRRSASVTARWSCPGSCYAFYDWGATVDPILPALAEEPVSSRTAVPYADLHAVDMLWTLDSLVQQERALPGQLPPLLGWLGIGAVVTGTDDDLARSGADRAR